MVKFRRSRYKLLLFLAVIFVGLYLSGLRLSTQSIEGYKRLFFELVDEQIAQPATTPNRKEKVGEKLTVKVINVVDGDSIEVLFERQTFPVRLSDIDAPEYNQPWGNRAEQALRRRVNRQSVQIHVTDVDRYGRLVARVYAQGRDVNEELVDEGHAWFYARFSRDRALAKRQRQSRAQREGLWAQTDPIPPWEWRSRKR